jgi:hypothetical protein
MGKRARLAGNSGSLSAGSAWDHGEIRRQNRDFAGTGGVSAGNRDGRFQPAYRHSLTGKTVLSCFADGRPAPVHLLEGLPAAWVVGRDDQGAVIRVDGCVVAGFMRDGEFYTREAAAAAIEPDVAGSPPERTR